MIVPVVAVTSLLAFASPGDAAAVADDEPAEAGQDPDAIEDEAVPEDEIDPAVAAMIASLSPEAQARLDELGDDELGTLIDRHVQGPPLTGVEGEIAEGYLGLFIAAADGELTYQTGDVTIADGLATLRLGEGFRYLGPDDARRVIVQMWENPPENGESLGMIVPSDISPADPRTGWGVIVTYTEDGHVEDDDAEDIDYDELLEEMQADTQAANPERVRRGFPEMTLVGWAEPPRYDSDTKRLYWAKQLSVTDGAEDTLNYDIRVLGRKGVLELSAVGAMSQLSMIGPQMEKVLSQVDFEKGNRYEDFDPDIDTVAAYGIGGLVAGKILAKAGFFAILLKFLIGAKKLLIVGFIAVGLFVRRVFTGRKREDDITPTNDDPGSPTA
jgi:uncharacterized membrane-anchored protein